MPTNFQSSLRITLILFLSLFSITTASIEHECTHDPFEAPLYYIPGTASSKTFSSNERMLQQSYQNIRIHIDYTNLGEANDEQRDYIQNQLMLSTVNYYHKALKIIPLENNLILTNTCNGTKGSIELQTTGVPADLVVLVVARHYGPPSFIAASSPCGISEVNSRPSFGVLRINLDNMDISTVTAQEQMLTNVMHEFVHILGFTKSAYPNFIDPLTNQKLTNHVRTTFVNGMNTTVLDLKPLTTRLRKYFNCDTIEGAYLENEGTAGSRDSHFERRIFLYEMMTSTSRVDQVISEFTLALLEGSGWYQPDYTMAERFTWGKGKGCSFVAGPCVSEGGQPLFDEYCSPLTQEGCSYTSRGGGYCGAPITRIQTDPNVLPLWNYWGNDTIVTYSFTDNCPVYSRRFASDCENPGSIEVAILPDQERYGVSSRCFTGTLTHDAMPAPRAAFCFQTKCERRCRKQIVRVKVGNKSLICKKKGTISVPGLVGKLECPDPKSFCATTDPAYCVRSCLGRGKCVRNRCVCPDGWGGKDCGSRVYKDKCSRCEGETVNTSCYGDLCRSNPNVLN